ncbi:MAG: hypothetical protein PHN74_00260 [Candidatus Pacebacteria bacterium]|nr:hypothetical protein [Candidatus Paceibacterota bacterium]
MENYKVEKEKSLLERTREEFVEKIKAEKEKGEDRGNLDLLGINPDSITEEDAKLWNRLKNVSTLEEGMKIKNELMRAQFEAVSKSANLTSPFWAYFANQVTGIVQKMELDELYGPEEKKQPK